MSFLCPLPTDFITALQGGDIQAVMSVDFELSALGAALTSGIGRGAHLIFDLDRTLADCFSGNSFDRVYCVYCVEKLHSGRAGYF